MQEDEIQSWKSAGNSPPYRRAHPAIARNPQLSAFLSPTSNDTAPKALQTGQVVNKVNRAASEDPIP